MHADEVGRILSAEGYDGATIARAQDIDRCIQLQHPSPAERRAVTQDCTRRNPDAFLDGLPTYH